MRNCDSIDSLVTPYVDGELADADRRAVDAHAACCAPCQSRIAAERAVRGLVRTRAAALDAPRPSASLRARCTEIVAARSVRPDAAPAPPRGGRDAGHAT